METVGIKKKQVITLDTETSGLDTFKCQLKMISVHEDGKSWVTFGMDQSELDGKYIIAHNGKYDAKVLKNTLGLNVHVDYDTKLAYNLTNPDKPAKLETIVENEFGVHKVDMVEIYNSVTGKNRVSFPEDYYEVVPDFLTQAYAEEDVEWTYKIAKLTKERLEENPEIKRWFLDYEMPLANILTQTELTGVKVDVDRLKELQAKAEKQLHIVEWKLKMEAGNFEMNLNSPKQLQEVMYKKLKLPVLFKTKTKQPSTATATLKKLAERHPFAKNLLKYRELSKLLTGFVIPLQEKADENGRIHASFNQIGTKTYRFSCTSPNLQQIPAHSDLGGSIRKCFVPSEGNKFIISDYSQIELRLLAHFSQEPRLLQAYKNNEDIHQQTADYISKQLGREFTRFQGKTLNFSIIYGKTSHGFAKDWQCSVEEAQQVLDAYFDLFPRVKEWITEQQSHVICNKGWFKNIAGLKLFVHNTDSNDKWKFEEAKRQAVNYLIQSSSQMILKKAVVNIYSKYGIHPLLLVHDELVYEVEDASIQQHILAEMENAWELSVPLLVDSKISDWWEK